MDIDSSAQWQLTQRAILRVLLPAALVMGAVLLFAWTSEVHVSELLRDTTDILNGKWYVGVFSTAGIVVWAATAAICLLVLSAVERSGQSRILTAGTVISLIFAIDDALLIHEVFPGKREVAIFAIYAFVAGAYLWRARNELWQAPNLGVLTISVGLLVLSLVMDFGRQGDLWSGRIPTTIGGVSKYLGAVMWITFFAGTCRQIIQSGRDLAPASQNPGRG